jgi:branched-chain amino acid aminotransferase
VNHFCTLAPLVIGHAKLGGNYSPGLKPTTEAKKRGFTVLLFLDAKTNSFIEEFATSNFMAITPADKDGKRHYVTPKSQSILDSVTNMSLAEVGSKDSFGDLERNSPT